MGKLLRYKEFIALLLIIIVDLVTKLMANNFLPFDESVPFIGNKVIFHLIYNEGATGVHANVLLKNAHDKNLIIIQSCFTGLILLGYILYIRKRKMHILYKILIGIGLFFFLNIVTGLIEPLFIDISISSYTASIAGKLTGIIIYGTMLFFATNKWIRILLIIIIAGGFGNLISHFYPPYRIIDFIYIERLYDAVRIGIFNVADLVFDIGFLGLIMSLLIIGGKKIIKNF